MISFSMDSTHLKSQSYIKNTVISRQSYIILLLHILTLGEGPIIRISPYELHIIDPAFFEKLYRQDGRWDKYAWAYDAHSAKHSTIFTTEHHLHRARRAPLNPFFSKAKVASRQALISRNVDKFCERISEFSQSAKLMDIRAAISEFTRCTAAEFIIGKTYDSLEKQDFSATTNKEPPASLSIWHVTKHFPLYGPSLMKMPTYWIKKSQGGGVKSFLLYLKVTASSSSVSHGTIANFFNVKAQYGAHQGAIRGYRLI